MTTSIEPIRITPRRWLAGGSLLVLALLAYLPLIHAGYIWDDDSYLLKNGALHTARGLLQIWIAPLKAGIPQYYPLTFSSFWAEYHVWGLRPLGFHIVNVVLHGISAVVLWRLLRRLEIPGSWLAAAIFTVHPVHVESVAWISERKNILSGLLYLLALTAYLNYSPAKPNPAPAKRGWYFLSLLLFVLALLAKSVTSSLPAAVLLVIYWKRGKITWRDLLPLVPFFAFGVAMGSVTSWMERNVVGAAGPQWQFSTVQRILIAGRALWFYAQKLVWPANLCFMYPKWVIQSKLIVYSAAAAIGLISLWVLRRRIGREPIVAVLFFVGTLIPALGFINVYPMRYSFVADHFQYLASIGLIALVVAGFAHFLRRFAPGQTQAGAILGGGVLVLLLWGTFNRAFAFSDQKTLWTDTLAKNPNSWMAHNNLGIVYFADKDFDRALAEFKIAAALEPNSAEAELNAARVELVSGTVPEALQYAQLGLSYAGPGDNVENRAFRSRGWFVVGVALFREGDECGAEAAFWKVVANDPGHIIAHSALAQILEFHDGDWKTATRQWEIVAQLDPSNAQAHGSLATLYAAAGRYNLANREMRLALSENPQILKQLKGIKSPSTGAIPLE